MLSFYDHFFHQRQELSEGYDGGTTLQKVFTFPWRLYTHVHVLHTRWLKSIALRGGYIISVCGCVDGTRRTDNQRAGTPFSSKPKRIPMVKWIETCVFGTEKIESENHDRMKQHETFLYFVFFFFFSLLCGYSSRGVFCFIFLGLSEYKEKDGKIIEIQKKRQNFGVCLKWQPFLLLP